MQLSPLSVPSTPITVSSVPSFIPKESLENEVNRFGKFAHGFKEVAYASSGDVGHKRVACLQKR